MSARILVRLAFLAMGLLAALTCQAHKPSDSYLTLAIDQSKVAGQWDIALRDLDFALGLDADADGRITWGEVRARHGDIAAYALGRLALRTAGEPCTLSATSHLIDEHTDGAYAVLMLAGDCPRAVEALQVDYRLLFDVDAQHRGLMNLRLGGEVRSAVFSAETPVQAFGASEKGAWRQFASFVMDGVKHIASGFDHLLFLLALLLPAVLVRRDGRWEPASDAAVAARTVIGLVTAFTLAHSVTLSLAALEIVKLPSRLVESAIAASVLLTALDNLFAFLPRRRWLVAFVFGLLHGFGFASVLLDLQLPASALALSLFGFNVGVELGQLVVVAAVVPLAFLARARPAYRRIAVAAGSAAIAFVSLGWLVERAFQLPFMPV